MKIDELKSIVNDTEWFSMLGNFVPTDCYLSINGLEPWSNKPCVSADFAISEHMEWLPTSKDEVDPFHSCNLKTDNKKYRTISLDTYKLALRNLRDLENISKLRVGPHDYTNSAKGAALYAIRHATFEILLNKQNYWSKLIRIYAIGNWPCGILPDKKIVVL